MPKLDIEAALKEHNKLSIEDALRQEQLGASQQKQSWGDVATQAIVNTPQSAVNFAKGIYQSVRHPLDTGMALWDAAAGGLHNITPDAVSGAVDKIAPSQNTKRAVNTADAIGQFYKQRYGSMEGLKNTISTDPVGALSDVSAVLTGGAALAPKASKLGQILSRAGEVTNPVNMAGKAVKAAGGLTADVIGGIGTHTGGESLKQAFRSGMEGGQSQASLIANMRGKAPMTDVLNAAKANLDDMARAKSAEYRAGMAKVSGDKSVLSFDGIDSAMRNAGDAVQFKGQIKNARAADLLQKISNEVNAWKKLPASEYHTPEGLDALKQKIGALVEGVPFEEKTARMVGNKVYHAIKDEITKQAPVYSDVMKGYSEASDQIKEIERALSLGGKASVDTTMRKLQSLTRNNANTNYGNRLDLANQLAAQGGREIMPALSGQALNTWTPRGIGNAVAGVTGMGAAHFGGPAAGLATLAAQSPRLMGESALKAGQLARVLKATANTPAKLTGKQIDPATLANILYQAGRLPQ